MQTDVRGECLLVRMRSTGRFALAVCVVAGVVTAHAQSSTSDDAQRLARRAAAADAYRKLAAILDTVAVSDTVRVRDLTDRSDAFRAVLDERVRSARLADPRFASDGSCEITAELPLSELADALRSSERQPGSVIEIADQDLERLSARLHRRVLRVVGRGWPRPDLPPGLPAGVEALLGAPRIVQPLVAGPPLPTIWNGVPPRERILAVEAARRDALRKLAERVAGARVSSSAESSRGDAESVSVRTEVSAHLVGAAEVGLPYFHDDSLVVEVRMSIPSANGAVEAIGVGVPSADVLRSLRVPQTASPDRHAAVRWPSWAEHDLTAEGRGTDADIASPQGRLRAARSAEKAARQNLADALGTLVVDGERRVADIASKRDDIAALLTALVDSADVTETRFDADGVMVRLRVAGMRAWEVVRDEVARP